MWDLKYNTDQHIYETKTDSQTQRTDVVAKGFRGGRGMEWEVGVSRCKLVYI